MLYKWHILFYTTDLTYTHICTNTLRKKGTKAVTGEGHFQKVDFCTLFTPKGCI